MQQIVDKTIMEGDHDHDGKLSFEEFAQMVSNTVCWVAEESSYSTLTLICSCRIS